MSSLLRELLSLPTPQTILLLGASDTGKTTLIETRLRDWTPPAPIALVDCDIGQSRIGPPTTIAWGLLDGPLTRWAQVTVASFAFVGTVSPEGNAETFLSAANQIVGEARASGRHVLIDSTGLVAGDLGIALKRGKLAALKPDVILAFERAGELAPILSAAAPGTRIERAPASRDAVRRSLAERAAYRNQAFVRYFITAAKQTLALGPGTLGGLGPDWPDGKVVVEAAGLMDRVVSLRDAAGGDLALGLLRDVDPTAGRLTVLTPLRDVSAAARVMVGSVRWPEDAVEIALPAGEAR